MVPATILEFNSEGLRQFRQIHKEQTGSAFLIVPVWLMAVAFQEQTQCERGPDSWFFPCGGWEFIWPGRSICSERRLRKNLFLLPEKLWQLLYLLLSPSARKQTYDSAPKREKWRTYFSFCLANLQTLISPWTSRRSGAFPQTSSSPSRESDSSAQPAVLCDCFLLLSF